MKRKVLFIIPSLDIGGGAERVVANLTLDLAEKYNIFIITFYTPQNPYLYNGKLISLKIGNNISKKIFLPINLFKSIRKIKPDVILSFLDHTNIIVILVKIIFRIKIPLIISIHCNPIFEYKEKDRFLNPFIKMFYPRKAVSTIITISYEIQELLTNFYGINKNKFKLIYNGIDTEEIKKASSQNIKEINHLMENKDIIKFITVGRLTEGKGLTTLLFAFSKVVEQIKNTILIIIGEGPLKSKLENIIKNLNLGEKVLLLGLKKNPFKYISQSNIFVLTNEYAGFPMVLLEALACGLPIISTNCKTGPNEILDHGKYGILIKINDINDLTNKMIFLAKDNDARNLFITNSTERAKYFDVHRIKEIWINLIDSFFN